MLKKNQIKLEATAIIENLPLIRNMVRCYLDSYQVKENCVLQLVTAVDELVTNVIEHAYRYRGGLIYVTIDKVGRGFSLSIEDSGQGIEKAKDDNLSNYNYGEDRGMGLTIVEGIADKFLVKREKGNTRFCIFKEVEEENNEC